MKSFDEVFIDSTKHCTKIKTDQYHEKGKYIIIDQGQSEIAGYTDLENGLFSDVPAIIFGDHTRVIKYIDEPFFIGADGVKVLKSKLENANYKYLFYALKNAKIPNTGYNRHFKWLKETKINYPDNEKQAEIVSILDKLQSIINHRQKQLEKLDELIKARFVEMFGKCQEYKKLEEYTELITKGASPKWQGIDYSNEGTLFVTSENVREGYLDLEKRKYLPNDINKILPRSVLKRNDILINIVNASIGRVAIYESDELANINQAVALVRLKPNVMNLLFLLTFLNSDEAINQYNFMKVGGDKSNLSLKNIADLKIPVASLEAQRQFADFVKQVDKSKVVVQKHLEKAQLLFDSLMQEYFG